MGYGKSHCIHIYFNSILRLTNRFTETLEYYNRSDVIILEVIILQKSFGTSSIVTIKLCEESLWGSIQYSEKLSTPLLRLWEIRG